MFLVMVRYIIPALLITATFTSAKIFFVIIIGGVLAVLFILTLKEAAKKKSWRRLPYDDALDSRYRDASFYVLWLSLTMHDGRGNANDWNHPGTDTGFGRDFWQWRKLRRQWGRQ